MYFLKDDKTRVLDHRGNTIYYLKGSIQNVDKMMFLGLCGAFLEIIHL